MPTAVIDGITTRYQLVGSGPPLLMFSPGGFNATLDNWSGLGIYRSLKPVEHLSQRYTCVIFDRRESGRSGGRVERVTWAHYVAQGKYRITGHSRFARHLAYAQEEGLERVVALATSGDRHFGHDPRVGPWASVMRLDAAFAERFAAQDADQYQALLAGMVRTLLDRDTVCGAEPEDMLQLDTPALIVPGADPSHATSAARYLEECLPAADYWDAAVADQTEQNVPPRILAFLDASSP